MTDYNKLTQEALRQACRSSNSSSPRANHVETVSIQLANVYATLNLCSKLDRVLDLLTARSNHKPTNRSVPSNYSSLSDG